MNNDEYEIAMKRIEVLMDIDEFIMTVEEQTELDILASSCEEYESIHYPMTENRDTSQRNY